MLLAVPGLLFLNRCTWAHILLEAARVLGLPSEELLAQGEMAALEGRASPHGVIIEISAEHGFLKGADLRTRLPYA